MQSADQITDKMIYLPLPYLFNQDYYSISQMTNMIDINSCNVWYLYNFDENVTEAEREFFGSNPGNLNREGSYGMIGDNIEQSICRDLNKSVPYFNEYEESDEFPTMNSYIFNKVETLSNTHIVFNNKSFKYEELEAVPDGAVTLHSISQKKLSYNLQINDSKYWQYHRDNGVTKIGVYDQEMNKT